MKKSNIKELWTGPECLTCLSTIAYENLKTATDNSGLQLAGMKKTYEILGNFTLNSLPTEIANKIYRMIFDLTDNFDPFKNIKKQSNILAKKAIKRIYPHIKTAKTLYGRFLRALAAAITGNMIDFGTAGHSIELSVEFLEKAYNQIIKDGFAIDHSTQLFELITNDKEIIYIADNAGEIYFDWFLLDQMKSQGVKIILVVKGAPVSNDATMDDVNNPIFKEIVTKIITTGTNALGVSITESSPEFLNYLQTASFIIVKGQSNFETLYYHHNKITHRPIFFIFRIKCPCIARFLGHTVGKNIVMLKNP